MPPQLVDIPDADTGKAVGEEGLEWRLACVRENTNTIHKQSSPPSTKEYSRGRGTSQMPARRKGYVECLSHIGLARKKKNASDTSIWRSNVCEYSTQLALLTCPTGVWK